VSFFADLDFAILWHYRLALFSAIGMTCGLAAASFLAASPIAVMLATSRRWKSRTLRMAASIFIELWRDTPLLVQALWVHFALPMVTHVNTTPVESGLIALTFNNAAYMSEIFRGGIDGIGRGQWEAADALGLGAWPKWRHVLLPQALRIVMPPLTGFAISVLKGTAIISILAVTELMRVSTQINNVTFRPVEIFTFAAGVYLVTGLLIFAVGKSIEFRFAEAGMRRS
jgi:polar amino acid transport system permease protein